MTITTTPEARVSHIFWLFRTNAPNAEAVKPRIRNTVDRPMTKNSARITRRARLAGAGHLAHADPAM
jgi:hypothetical protein